MLEIVFSDGAMGGLKAAQNYGASTHRSVGFGVICGADGPPNRKITQQEMDDFLRQAQLDWENGKPLGGSPEDIYGFHLAHSIGDISEDILGEKRLQVLDWLYSIYPDSDEEPSFTVEMMKSAKKALAEVSLRISAGEAVRIWYSNQPDEHCGLYWFMAQIHQLNLQEEQVFLVALPDWETRSDGALRTYNGWGEMDGGRFHHYLDLQRTAPPVFCHNAALHWQQLQQENAPLRILLNGRLASAPESIYDPFILREIEAAEDEFQEALIISRVITKYSLGIGDAWIAHRIEAMIASGILTPITEPAKDSPIYHRWLKKCVSMG